MNHTILYRPTGACASNNSDCDVAATIHALKLQLPDAIEAQQLSEIPDEGSTTLYLVGHGFRVSHPGNHCHAARQAQAWVQQLLREGLPTQAQQLIKIQLYPCQSNHKMAIAEQFTEQFVIAFCKAMVQQGCSGYIVQASGRDACTQAASHWQYQVSTNGFQKIGESGNGDANVQHHWFRKTAPALGLCM